MTTQRDLDSVLAAHAPRLMEIPGVAGVYRSETGTGNPCIKVMVEEHTEEVERQIPKILEGYPVLIEVSGKIRPLN